MSRSEVTRPPTGYVSQIEQRLLPALERSAVGLLALIVLGVVSYHIASRLMGTSYRWTEEAARLGTIWATFLSVPLFVRAETLLAIRVGQSRLSRRRLTAIRLITNLVTAAVMAVILRLSLPQAISDWGRTSPGLDWPMGLFTLPLSIMAALSLIHALPLIHRHTRSLLQQEADALPHRPTDAESETK